MLLAACVLALAATTTGSLAASGSGFDLSSLPSVSAIQCMHNSGYNAMFMRAYQSLGRPDPNAYQAIQNAHSAGLPYIDVYMFPCPTCGTTPATQFNALITNLKPLIYGRVWLDVEEDSSGQYWSTSYGTNQNFYQGLINACISTGYKCGVYSNYNNWVRIFGSSTYQATNAAQYPVWYASWDGQNNYNNYAKFGGWTTPGLKQHTGDTSMCGLGVDLNWYSNNAALWDHKRAVNGGADVVLAVEEEEDHAGLKAGAILDN